MGALGKAWKFISTISGISGFVSGVVKNDIKDSPTFQDRDFEGKLQHIADVFFGRVFGFSPFGIAPKTRKLKPLGWLNTSTMGAALALVTNWAVKQAPSFPFKGKITQGLSKGVFPFLLFQGLGAVFDPPASSPAGTGLTSSRVVELETGLA